MLELNNKTFAWIEGPLTLEWAVGKVGYIRCMKDPNHWPGDVIWSCAIEIFPNGECEIKILSRNRPTGAQTKILIRYFKSLGCTGGWWRYKNGKPPKKINIP